MKKVSFPFKSETIELILPKSDTRLFDNISLLIEELSMDLDTQMLNSSVHRFNNSQKGFPFFVRDEFLEFLAANIKMATQTQHQFFPFEPLISEGLDQAIFIDVGSKTVIKTEDLKIKSSSLLKTFILDSIANSLRDYGLNLFLLSAFGFNIADGEHEWSIKSDLENTGIKITNEVIYTFAPLIKNVNEPKTNRFANTDKFVYADSIILTGNDPLRLKAISEFFPASNYLDDYRNFLKKWDIVATIVDSSGNIVTV